MNNENALKVDKTNGEILYNDEFHKYWIKDSDQSCISVTSLIHNYTTFDEPFWSKYKAIQRILTEDVFDGPIIGKQKVKGKSKDKRGPASDIKKILLQKKEFDYKYLTDLNISEKDFNLEVEKIIKEWSDKRETSCIRGTGIHREQELRLLAGKCNELKHYNLSGNFTTNTSNKLIVGSQNIYPEMLLSRVSPDGKLRLAGQADLIIQDNFDIYCIDFKTNESIDKESYYDSLKKKKQTMLYPLNNIQDSNFWHYSLQLSTYCWMIQKQDPRFNIKGLLLIHYDHEGGCTTYNCDYLKSDVERMLMYYKKQIEHEEFKKSIAKVVF